MKMEGNIIKKIPMNCNRCVRFFSRRLARSVYSWKVSVMLHVELGRMPDEIKNHTEGRKLESKVAGWGRYCWVRLISVHSLGRQSVHVAIIGSWSWWQHGQCWAPFASVPATEGQAYWEAVWWTQWVRQTCCINSVFAAVARNKP